MSKQVETPKISIAQLNFTVTQALDNFYKTGQEDLPLKTIQAEANKLEKEFKRIKNLHLKNVEQQMNEDSNYRDFIIKLDKVKETLQKRKKEENKKKQQEIIKAIPEITMNDIKPKWLNKGVSVDEIAEEYTNDKLLKEFNEAQENLKDDLCSLQLTFNSLSKEEILKIKTQIKLMGYEFSSEIKGL